MISEADKEYYLSVARKTASRSKAKRLQVGAVLVSTERMMAIGYNGTPSGSDNACEDIGPDGDLVTKPEVIHGEINALFKFLNSGTSSVGSTMFITHAPCLECSKSLYLAKVSAVFYDNEYRSNAGIEFLKARGIRVEQINSHSRGSMDDYEAQAPHCPSPHGRD